MTRPLQMPFILTSIITLCLQACSLTHSTRDGPPSHAIDVTHIANAQPKYEPKSRYGNPRSYVALGKRYYVLKSAKNYNERGIASWYGRKFHGRLTSNRERYNMLAMTAASPILPIPSYVRVTNLENNRSVIVRVNDRGPFAPNRIIDLSYAAAKKLGYSRKGTALVQVAVVTSQNQAPITSSFKQQKPELYLQLGAFSDLNSARALKQKLSPFTTKLIQITKAQSHQKTLYRVRIGPLVGVGESDTLFNQLNQHGLNSAITIIA
jgi:rare lipoprotein A